MWQPTEHAGAVQGRLSVLWVSVLIVFLFRDVYLLWLLLLQSSCRIFVKRKIEVNDCHRPLQVTSFWQCANRGALPSGIMMNLELWVSIGVIMSHTVSQNSTYLLGLTSTLFLILGVSVQNDSKNPVCTANLYYSKRKPDVRWNLFNQSLHNLKYSACLSHSEVWLHDSYFR